MYDFTRTTSMHDRDLGVHELWWTTSGGSTFLPTQADIKTSKRTSSSASSTNSKTLSNNTPQAGSSIVTSEPDNNNNNSNTNVNASTSTTGLGAVSTSDISTSVTSNENPSTILIPTTITTSTPSTFTSHSSTFTTLIPTTVTTSSIVLASDTSGSLWVSVSQPVCIGNVLDVSAVGLLSTLVLSSVVGILIWLLFAILRPRFRQIYSVREWFPPQTVRPEPLSNSFWVFIFPHVPFVPSVPDENDVMKARTDNELPVDGQFSQRVLWVCFLVVLGWSFLGLAGLLPLYLVNTPCLAQSIPQARFGGIYSVLQDLSLLRLLQLLEDENITTSSKILARAVVNGNDVTSNIRTRIIILTVFTIVLGMLPALRKIFKEFNRLVNYRHVWLEIRCEGLEMGWLSAEKAPGFLGMGEKRIKDFIVKTGLSATLDKNSGIGSSGVRQRAQSHRAQERIEKTRDDEEKAALEIDVRSLFTVGDTGRLPALIAERDHILGQLEMAEARYIASFKLATPDPSVADLGPSSDGGNSLKRRISRPKALAGYQHHVRSRRGRRTNATSSTAPTSYVAPSQYYKLGNVRGISDGRIYSQDSLDEGPSFGDSVRSRIVGSRFQEVNHDDHGEALPIGSRVNTISSVNYKDRRGGSSNTRDDSFGTYGGQHHVADPSSGNEADTDTYPLTKTMDRDTSRRESGKGSAAATDDFPSAILVDSIMNYNSSPKRMDSGIGDYELIDNEEQNDLTPSRSGMANMREEREVPLHLRLQPQGGFVRPLSGLGNEELGSIYSDIGEWRTQLKQINNEISEAQNECYNDIADGRETVRGWLMTGRGLRFLPGIELIEGRTKDDILWDELQRQGNAKKKIRFWLLVILVTFLLAAGLLGVAGLAVASAPEVAHYLPFFQPLFRNGELIGPGIVYTLIPVLIATLFFFISINTIQYASHYSGNISAIKAQLSTYKATFFLLTVVGMMWFTAAGAVVFAMGAIATSSERSSTVASGSVYMSVFFLALIINAAIIAPGLLLLQPLRLKSVLWNVYHAITPRQRFRALYPKPYDPTYATACCILAVVLASTFSLIFPLIGPAVVLLLLLTLVAHRFLVGYVYGRTESQTGGLLQIWLLKRFATVVSLQPILLGLILLSKRLFIEGGISTGVGVVSILAIEIYAHYKTKQPGKNSLSSATLRALDIFEEQTTEKNTTTAKDIDGSSLGTSAMRMRSRGSMASVLDMMSLTLAVMPSSHSRGAVPIETESLDDLTATERAARTHPDAPPHLPALPFGDHADEMAGILYAPELLAPPPIIWLPNDSAGIAKSEAYDLQRYHGLKATIDVRSQDDASSKRSPRQRGGS